MMICIGSKWGEGGGEEEETEKWGLCLIGG